MSLHIKSNPINIVPFIDVLLVLLVILVVAARFDGDTTKEMARLNAIIEEKEKRIAGLTNTKAKVQPRVETRVVEKVIGAQPIIRTETKVVIDDSKMQELTKRIKELEDDLVQSKKAITQLDGPGTGRVANIVFGVDNSITVNGIDVDERFVYDLIKTVGVDINIGWRGRGHETADKFKKWASAQGYSIQ